MPGPESGRGILSRGQSASPERRGLLALLWLLLAGGALAFWQADRSDRAVARDFLRGALPDGIEPSEAARIALEPAGDLALAATIAALLPRGDGKARAGASGRPTQPRWNPSELREARRLALGAVASRPGWPGHRYLLGLLSASSGGVSEDDTRRAVRTLRVAARAAPGRDEIWAALGACLISGWEVLEPDERARSGRDFRRALVSEDFVASHFLALARQVGIPAAIRLLPDRAGPTRAATAVLAQADRISAAALLLAPLERAERRERTEDLKAIEERNRLGDVEGQKKACRSWVSRHPFHEFDDAEGRAQVARVLELWPDDRFGSWRRSPRGAMVRFFLDGRQTAVRGEVLNRTVNALTGVPDSIRARTRLLAGDLSGAEELARLAGAPPPREWTPFFADRAAFDLRRGRSREARLALERLSPGEREECDVLLLRRRVAVALADRNELAATTQRIEWHRALTPSGGGFRGSLPLCLDEERNSRSALVIAFDDGPPALVAYGWDGGRSGVLALPSSAPPLRVPLAGRRGRREFWVSVLAGPPDRSSRVSLENL